MKKSKLYWLIGLLIVILGVAGYFLMGSSNSEIQYRLGKIERGDIIVNISATGTLQALTTVQVGSQVSGTIAKLYADFNSVVEEGQLLAQLDPTFLQASVNEQRANLDRATAAVNETKRNLDRVNQLFAKSLVSQADLDAALTSHESAVASLKQAEASLQRAEVNLRYATIRAPISGVVISRNVDVGQTVAASLQAPTIFTIANDLKKMKVEASVDEADIGNVKVAQAVSFRVDAYPEEQFAGQVSQIRLSPVISQNVVTYTVIIDVENPEEKLMPGMTATVSIEVARRENVLRVAIAALRYTPTDTDQEKSANRADSTAVQKNNASTGGLPQQGTERQFKEFSPNTNRIRLWTLENGMTRPLSAVKGIQNSKYAEIMETELKEGDEIIIGTVGVQATQTTRTGQNQTNPFAPRFPGGR